MTYLYYSHIGEWTKPPKRTTLTQLVACYRHVRRLDVTGKKVAWWDDGVKYVPVARKIRP
jgi:hypothetical protein